MSQEQVLGEEAGSAVERHPEWRQDSSELFFMRPGGMIMSAAFGENGFSEPVELFQVAVRATDDYDLFDVTPDGKRFLLL